MKKRHKDSADLILVSDEYLRRVRKRYRAISVIAWACSVISLMCGNLMSESLNISNLEMVGVSALMLAGYALIYLLLSWLAKYTGIAVTDSALHFLNFGGYKVRGSKMGLVLTYSRGCPVIIGKSPCRQWWELTSTSPGQAKTLKVETDAFPELDGILAQLSEGRVVCPAGSTEDGEVES